MTYRSRAFPNRTSAADDDDGKEVINTPLLRIPLFREFKMSVGSTVEVVESI
jgi:hypothetical protein